MHNSKSHVFQIIPKAMYLKLLLHLLVIPVPVWPSQSSDQRSLHQPPLHEALLHPRPLPAIRLVHDRPRLLLLQLPRRRRPRLLLPLPQHLPMPRYPCRDWPLPRSPHVPDTLDSYLEYHVGPGARTIFNNMDFYTQEAFLRYLNLLHPTYWRRHPRTRQEPRVCRLLAFCMISHLGPDFIELTHLAYLHFVDKNPMTMIEYTMFFENIVKSLTDFLVWKYN